MQSKEAFIFLQKIAGLFIFSVYFIYCATRPQGWHFIDSADFVIHEAGHVLFLLAPQFLYIAAGSMVQVGVPMLFAAYFFYKRQIFSSSLVLLWLGYNFINVSVYAKDALKMELPLIGGDNVIHDWNYLLSSLNLLIYTDAVGLFLYYIGMAIIISATIIGLVDLIKEYELKSF